MFGLERFANEEGGETTIDWVVLTAIIVGLGLIVMAAIRPAITGAGEDPPAVESKE